MCFFAATASSTTTAESLTAIEVALDTGEIRAGTTYRPISEVELELKAGPVTALFDLARELQRIVPVPLRQGSVVLQRLTILLMTRACETVQFNIRRRLITYRRLAMPTRYRERIVERSNGRLIATVDRSDFQYLYNDGTDYIFMDPGTFDQIPVTPEVMGNASKFLLENNEAVVARHEGNVLYVELPPSVELEITYTEPGLQGDRSTGGTKPATVETGYQIQVPLFLEQGTKVKVDTRSGDYLGRVNE